MTAPLSPRTTALPIQMPQPTPWSAGLLGQTATPPQAGVPATPAPTTPADGRQGLNGAGLLAAATAAGVATPTAPAIELAAAPKVKLPEPIVPSVSLTGSTQNQIDALIRTQQGQVDAFVAGLEGLGFEVDPRKTSLGLTPSQQFYADMVGALMGVEDSVKETDAYDTLNKLYISMPSQLTDAQLTELSRVSDLLFNFGDMIDAANETHVSIIEAKAAKNNDEVAWLESRLAVAAQAQQSRIEAIVAELQRLNYTIDEDKISDGLTPSQRIYSAFTGLLVGAEPAVREMPEFETLHHLFVSMPNELSEAQIRNLSGVSRRLEAFAKSMKTINEFQVDLATARSKKNDSEIKRLEGEIARETGVQQAEVRAIVAELQRLNYTIDESKLTSGLTATQQFYADLTGLFVEVEDAVKETEDYKRLYHLFLSMPKDLSAEQLAALEPFASHLSTFPATVDRLTTLRMRLNEESQAKNQAQVDRLKTVINEVTETQKRGVTWLANELERLGYTIDESKITTGLSPSQQFYASMVGVLQGAEESVRETDAYTRFHELYLSMPNDLDEAQLAALEGVASRMAAFEKTVKEINAFRVSISESRAGKDEASVARYERQIAELTAVQNREMAAMVADLEGLNYKVDPNKTSLGLTRAQQFYADMVGVLMGVEESVKESEVYRTLHHLYVSMPSQLSDAQLDALSRVDDLLFNFQEMIDSANKLHVRIAEAKSSRGTEDVGWLESRLAVAAQAQQSRIEAIVAELQRLDYKIDESKLSDGLTPAQAFYRDLSGVLAMAEEPVRRSDSYKRLAQLFASMPSDLSEAQIRQLQGLWGQVRGFDPISDKITSLRVLQAKERA